MFVQGAGGYFDVYFAGSGGISALSYTDRVAASLSLVINLGESIIEPGDRVAMAGVAVKRQNR